MFKDKGIAAVAKDCRLAENTAIEHEKKHNLNNFAILERKH
jgi:hypothetical protein